MDQLLGLLLLGLGLKTTPFSTPSVMGDETTANVEVEDESSPSGEKMRKPLPPQSGKPPVLNKAGLIKKSVPVEKEKEDREDKKEASDNRGVKRQIRVLKGEFHDEIVTQRANFQENLKEMREELKEEREASRAAFLEKVEKIRDEKKQEILKKMAEKCTEITSNRTEKMSEMLSKLSTILENVTSRAATAKENGKETSSVDAAVEKAAEAIATAQAAVTARAGVDCTLSINTEDTLRADVGKAISGLQSELKAVSDKVLTARKLVGDAIKALGLALGEPLTKK